MRRRRRRPRHGLRCHHCGHRVSIAAQGCPSCGEPVPLPFRRWLVYGLHAAEGIALIVIIILTLRLL